MWAHLTQHLAFCVVSLIPHSQDTLTKQNKVWDPLSPFSLTLCPVRHQVHLAVRALPQLSDMLILLGYICCWQRGDGQGLHVLHRHRSAVARLGCGRAPSAAHPARPGRRKRQARLDAVGQTAGRGKNAQSRSYTGMTSFVHVCCCIHIAVCAPQDG